jgi:hypothetical protein
MGPRLAFGGVRVSSRLRVPRNWINNNNNCSRRSTIRRGTAPQKQIVEWNKHLTMDVSLLLSGLTDSHPVSNQEVLYKLGYMGDWRGGEILL